ncbi:hypothetical protein TNCT_212261 [Trichonephila clavata]|uniref:Uncharacterized protein n=1 Tax=Trichonephila clavata TaxID=2740835 RepID=A0A8X6KIH2_TRICU|nr:hypothetical protein TNCT_212261 [Trichonephila clavata]
MRSMSLQRMQVSEMGLQLVAAFSGLRMGIMTKFFQILGSLPERHEVLKMFNRCLLEFSLKCVIIWPKMRSGLRDFFGSRHLIASSSSAAVKSVGIV